MYRLIILSLAFLFFAYSKEDIKVVSVTSPNCNFRFELKMENETPYYEVYFNDIKIIDKSSLGFKIADAENNLMHTKIEKLTKNSVDTVWKPIYGEKNQYPDKYNETTINLVSVADEKPIIKINIRAYNEGVAFRYEFNNDEETVIEKELTEFTFLQDSDVWVSETAQDEIIKKKISELTDEIVERPLVAQLNDSLFVAIGEANLIDFARMKFEKNPKRKNSLLASLDSKVVFNESFKSPWRMIMAGNSMGKLLEQNYIFLNLCEPNMLTSTDWIKPGKVIREVTLTTKGGIACIDFAVKHKMQFVEFDAGWYGHEYDKKSDASRVDVDPKRSPGPLDLEKVIKYANENGIGIILYVNQNALDYQIDKILPIYKNWGIKGVKYGFVNVGSQQATKWLHNAVQKAAENELMVDIHDEYRPTGLSRTYPNLMTQEGIRGDEEKPDNKQVLTTIFTRMLVGAGDQTNCYFAERVDKMGSHASQMAKTILIYSPWQFLYWYDRPEASPQDIGGGVGNTKATRVLRKIPDLQFYSDLPTVWDDIKVLEGEIGNYATIARKSEDNWFVGSLTDQPRKVKIAFNFLEKDKNYLATIYQDDDKLKTQTKVAIHKVEINSETELNFLLGEKKGLTIVIKNASF